MIDGATGVDDHAAVMGPQQPAARYGT